MLRVKNENLQDDVAPDLAVLFLRGRARGLVGDLQSRVAGSGGATPKGGGDE